MILLTGGSGLLGKELQKHMDFHAPSHRKFDICDPPLSLPDNIDMIVHCAAYTDVAKAERDKQACFDVNAMGTYHMAKYGVPLVYISTEYVFDGYRGLYREDDLPNPQNYYAITKFFGEEMARFAPRSLTVRTVFKPNPFEHPKACVDQWTSGDYVNVIAPMIVKAIENFGQFRDDHAVLHIGTGRKSVYDLAKQSRDVDPCYRKDIPVFLPRDTSLDLTKWEKLIG